MIDSLRAQSELNDSYIQEVPKNKGRIFLMSEVSELWLKTMVRNSHVFNLSNCAVVLNPFPSKRFPIDE